MISLPAVRRVILPIRGIELLHIEEDGDSVLVRLKYSGRGEVNKAKFFLNHFVEVEIPKTFPQDLPVTYEIGERQIRNYHHINPDKKGSFCLGTEFDIRKHLGIRNDLKRYFYLIADYITLYLYFDSYGNVPLKERSHGEQGILEAYQDFLKIKDIHQIIYLLSLVPVSNIHRNLPCPCGSGKKMKKCHYYPLQQLNKSTNKKKQIYKDIEILKYLLR